MFSNHSTSAVVWSRCESTVNHKPYDTSIASASVVSRGASVIVLQVPSCSVASPAVHSGSSSCVRGDSHANQSARQRHELKYNQPDGEQQNDKSGRPRPSGLRQQALAGKPGNRRQSDDRNKHQPTHIVTSTEHKRRDADRPDQSRIDHRQQTIGKRSTWAGVAPAASCSRGFVVAVISFLQANSLSGARSPSWRVVRRTI